MTLFVVIAAIMAAIACAWIVVPLLRTAAPADVVREASNVAILRDQLAELDRDVASGVIAREQYDVARREIERRVLEESQPATPAKSAPVHAPAAMKLAIAFAFVIPLAAAVIYYKLGDRTAFVDTAALAKAPQHDITPEQIDAMVASSPRVCKTSPTMRRAG